MITHLVKEYFHISEGQMTLPFRGVKTREDVLSSEGLREYDALQKTIDEEFSWDQVKTGAKLMYEHNNNLTATWYEGPDRIVSSGIKFMIPVTENVVAVKTQNSLYFLELLG